MARSIEEFLEFIGGALYRTNRPLNRPPNIVCALPIMFGVAGVVVTNRWAHSVIVGLSASLDLQFLIL